MCVKANNKFTQADMKNAEPYQTSDVCADHQKTLLFEIKEQAKHLKQMQRFRGLLLRFNQLLDQQNRREDQLTSRIKKLLVQNQKLKNKSMQVGSNQIVQLSYKLKQAESQISRWKAKFRSAQSINAKYQQKAVQKDIQIESVLYQQNRKLRQQIQGLIRVNRQLELRVKQLRQKLSQAKIELRHNSQQFQSSVKRMARLNSSLKHSESANKQKQIMQYQMIRLQQKYHQAVKKLNKERQINKKQQKTCQIEDESVNALKKSLRARQQYIVQLEQQIVACHNTIKIMQCELFKGCCNCCVGAQNQPLGQND